MDNEYRISQINKNKAVSDAILSTRVREGREEGIEQEKRKLALEFLKIGNTFEEVSKATGLDLETLKKLKNEEE